MSKGVRVTCEFGQVYEVYGYDFEGHGDDHAIYPRGSEEALNSQQNCVECGRSLAAALFENADEF